MQSTVESRPILFSTAPETGRLEFYNRLLPPLPRAMHNGALPPWPKDSIPPGPWDPALFHYPDSDRWFLYWGSSNEYPGSSVYTRFRISASLDGRTWRIVADLSREIHPLRARARRRRNARDQRHPRLRQRHGTGASHSRESHRRMRSRSSHARMEWSAVPGIVGVNIRWGLAPDKLYETYQRFAEEGHSLNLRALTMDQHYFFAIESFDERGVSLLSGIIRIF
ncbi:MAG: hypothetical protein H0U66_14985 [Gemmatimonadaceae bacterium]|nr:hypothetical protein [Gemmatimonadaceae bacterium]